MEDLKDQASLIHEGWNQAGRKEARRNEGKRWITGASDPVTQGRRTIA
jgi:hypothetical protein